MSDLNDLSRPLPTDTEPDVLDTLRAHIIRLSTWSGWSSTANKVAGLISATTAAVTGGRSLRLYRRNDANTSDEEIISLPGVSIGGNAATASAAQEGSALAQAIAAASEGSGSVPDGYVTTQKLGDGAATGSKLGADVLVSSGRVIKAVTASTIDCSTGNYFTKTITANTTFSFSGAPTGKAYGFTLKVVHTSGAITWPSSVRWAESTPPTIVAGGTSLFMFITDDGGSTWRGAYLTNFAA